MSDELRECMRYAVADYRGAWVKVGRLLNEIAYGGDYKEWGYGDFAEYCAGELGLKKPTVQRMMISYNYMKRYEAERLHDFEDNSDGESARGIPDFQTVELLDRVRREEKASEQQMDEMHRNVFGDVAMKDDIRKELWSMIRPGRQVDPDRAEKAGILKTARDLRKKMNASHFVPDGLKERIEQPLAELEALA